MRQPLLTFKCFVVVLCGVSIREIVHGEGEKQQWSKPENSIQNNDWIPVQGKCPTCRPNRDLEGQSTNEQIGNILSPPKSSAVSQSITSLPPTLVQPQHQLSFTAQKQPRILPFGSNFPQYNNPFANTDNKQFQAQSTKLTQESQKPAFYQFESPYVKQAYSLPSQQLIPQSPVIPQPSLPQRFPVVEPYPFTLPLKNAEPTTTPKITYQPKIRFPDSIPNNKITSQNTDEIQLLYVPIEATQRGRKNMNYPQNQYQQSQYQPPFPHGFIAPQYNFQYSPIPKQQESQFYFPANIPPASNYLQLNPVPPQRQETVYANLTKNLLQPYFTINGLYSSLPQVQQLPNKQPELPYYSVLQPGLYNPNPVKSPEQVFKLPPPVQPRPLQPVPVSAAGGTFLQSNFPNTISTFADVYAPTTTETTKNTDYVTESTGFRGTDTGKKTEEFTYQFVTSNPQTSAPQSQHFISDNKITSPSQNSPQFTQTPLTSKIPQKTSQAPFEETTNTNYPVPHQPPLSFYMEKVHNPKINDVLYLLKDAKTIPVLDTVETDPPQVFVGPSELPPPKGYIKFELPYLSSLDYNRIERMIDRLPFFVAPLNFKPPPGYSKIPFPAPHIGSVVLSNNTSLQESLHDKTFNQKYKQPTTQSFSAPPELSTITPQLTSQINSLLETQSSVVPSELTSFKNLIPSSPSVSEPVTFKNYGSQTEKITKKPLITNRPSSTTTTEPPKRTSNRQRKPIYRGYPTSTSTESTTLRSVPSTTESVQKYYSQSSKENENYVEFSAKGKFNINNGNENVVSSNPPASVSTYQESSGMSPTYQSPTDYSNFFSKFEQNTPAQSSQVQNENTYETQKPTQNVDYYSTSINGNSDRQNYPYYNPQSTPDTGTKSIQSASQVSTSEPESTQSANFNFNNVKPLSQYNPFNKDESQQPNQSEVLTTRLTNQPGQTNSTEFNFWTQNQFYKVNPNTVDYFSSTGNYPQETSSATPEPTRSPKTTTIAYQPETNHAEQSKDYTSSTEYVEQTTPTTHRPRIKQRIYPNRYHQSKHTTTEKENVDSQSYKTNTRLPPASDSTYESSSQSSDMFSQSTENHELSTRAEVKPHRRRRPIRPQTTNIVTPVTEISSSTSRSLRTRPTRYPGTATERYRPRRPTTSSESTETLNSEWSSYNNFVPSAPTSNEISVPADNTQNNEPKYSSTFWTDSSTANQVAEITSTTESVSYSKSNTEGDGTESTPWLSSPSKQTDTSGYAPFAYSPSSQSQFTVENGIENRTEIASERKDDSYHSEFKNTYRNKPLKSTFYEEYSSTTSPSEIKESSSDEPTSPGDENVHSQDAKKDRFNSDVQKKAHDPQDEKKAAGKRRVAFVRRIRVNKQRPQDVLETAESQNLGRITDNSLHSTDSKIVSKTEETEDLKVSKSSTVVSSSVLDEYVAPTEAITENEEEAATSPTTSFTPISTSSSSSSIDEYAMQNDFAQMLSDFLNSNDHSTKTVNNLERNNVSTENSISYILSLSNNDNGASIISNSSSENVSPTNSPTSEVTSADDVITITNNPITNTELVDHSTTPEDAADTYNPDKSLSTSTTTEISLETEICYRGKCVKTKKSKANDLLPVE